MKTLLFILCSAFVTSHTRCSKDPSLVPKEDVKYKTQNVIIVVVDGPRYTETWGFPTRQYIPKRYQMLNEGVLCSHFYNNGFCFTNAGHTAITTGIYQNINNGGTELPQKPSIFQYWLKATQKTANDAWVITSKDKLAVLADCYDTAWNGTFRPNTDCGISGLGTGYRQDSITFNRAKNILAVHHPQLVLINFKEPDASGHAADSAAYLQGIVDTDNYVYQLWQFLQGNEFYRGVTTLIVTNDHGRHTAGHLDGFVSHTDNCDGCKHIEFFAMGPDFKKNFVCSEPHDQIDIATTVAELMRFSMPSSNGKVIRTVFK